MKQTYNRRGFLAQSLAGAASVGIAACSRPPVLENPPNIVVYMPDSLRADALGCYGGSDTLAPVVDELARRSFVFEACYAQSNWTKPSVASIFTGMTPRVHKAAVTPWRAPGGFAVEPRMLREQFTTLAESMQALGYRTACFQTNPHPRDEFGFARGFDHFYFQLSEDASVQVRQFEEWLKEAPEQPFFAFIHQIKPHGPYQPSAADFLAAHGVPRHEIADGVRTEDAQRIADWTHAYFDDTGLEMAAAHNALRELSPEGVRYFRMLYEAEIHGVDRAVGELLEVLDRHEVSQRTALMFTSDHGEAFGERDFFGHGNYLYSEELRVPLLVHLPNQSQGIPVTSPVALYDLYPTCVALGGGTPESGIMAKPLFDRMGALTAEADRSVFAEMDMPTSGRDHWSQSMLQGERCLMRMNMPGREEESIVGFDLAADPGQEHPLGLEQLEQSEAWQRLIAQMEETLQRHRRLAAQTGPPEFSERSEEYDEELRALGYV